MQLSLSKFPWYGQIGAFVVVAGLAVFGFWKFYVVEMQGDIAGRQVQLTTLRGDIAKGVATARRLPQFQADVTELEHRLENLRAVLPEQKDVADMIKRADSGWVCIISFSLWLPMKASMGESREGVEPGTATSELRAHLDTVVGRTALTLPSPVQARALDR